ncbi:2OG-Fe(II) oxygenase family protein [Gimibacter soli]|uniref:2OG-Fe(II) oxygenase n=1 Tax=Gimibacter soli TaxID=3024400 RepID=A0AAF0BLF4_9PROT|nr:2OG-Fe(II) oxygenase [Gimibacter soli]WCL54092.1 2OG-Fe(II) oxygenase [Gimibacter soli]
MTQLVPPTLRLAPFVAPFGVDEGLLDDLIARLDAAEEATEARLAGGVADPNVRASTSLWLDLDTIPDLTSALIRFASATVDEAFPFAIDGFEEGVLLQRYRALGSAAPLGDHYDWHVDIGAAGTTRSRKLALVVQLSDPADYMGGLLEVNLDGIPVAAPAERGTAIAFPAFAPHRVTPVTVGTRYSLVAWMHGPAFR